MQEKNINKEIIMRNRKSCGPLKLSFKFLLMTFIKREVNLLIIPILPVNAYMAKGKIKLLKANDKIVKKKQRETTLKLFL